MDLISDTCFAADVCFKVDVRALWVRGAVVMRNSKKAHFRLQRAFGVSETW